MFACGRERERETPGRAPNSRSRIARPAFCRDTPALHVLGWHINSQPQIFWFGARCQITKSEEAEEHTKNGPEVGVYRACAVVSGRSDRSRVHVPLAEWCQGSGFRVRGSGVRGQGSGVRFQGLTQLELYLVNFPSSSGSARNSTRPSSRQDRSQSRTYFGFRVSKILDPRQGWSHQIGEISYWTRGNQVGTSGFELEG